MTDRGTLLEVRGSAPLNLLEADKKVTAEAAWAWGGAGLTVRTVRGSKMHSAERMFDEMAAALQFPYYFGENCAAFDECLADMDWLPMTVGIVIVILDSVEVFFDESAAQFGVLVRTIVDAARTYEQPIEAGEWWDRPAVPFHVVLQANPGDGGAVRSRWEGFGAEVSELAG